jgi:hypothetical protein
MIPTKCKFDTFLFHKYFAVPTLSYVNHDLSMSTVFHCNVIPTVIGFSFVIAVSKCLTVIVTVVLELQMQNQSFHFENISYTITPVKVLHS